MKAFFLTLVLAAALATVSSAAEASKVVAQNVPPIVTYVPSPHGHDSSNTGTSGNPVTSPQESHKAKAVAQINVASGARRLASAAAAFLCLF
ncbi:hypothetical protein BC830DRAFT_1122354 [Chytriomyces sp. MP71]|nr:hypothetical protein BC830DRAFT_1122354 [Chytriomyces sp. MP71]